MHYGIPGRRQSAACGVRGDLTTDRRQVTCVRCRGTVSFATQFFTESTKAIPAELNQRQGRSRRHREGARP